MRERVTWKESNTAPAEREPKPISITRGYVTFMSTKSIIASVLFIHSTAQKSVSIKSNAGIVIVETNKSKFLNPFVIDANITKLIVQPVPANAVVTIRTESS